MKFPSIFRTAKPMRFDIKPRYYDPVREEIEQRTERIRRELQADGRIASEDSERQRLQGDYGSGIRGAFAQGGSIGGRKSSAASQTGILRLLILIFLVGSFFGYVYLGPIMLYVLGYGGVSIAGLFFLNRLRKGRTR
ncbi:MAG: hypothetical protein ACXIT9_14105 [Nitritalea sp.]